MDVKTISALPSTNTETKTQENRRIANEFEASFLTEMLKYTGINKTNDSFGGGPGEEAFASLLTAEYAKIIVNSGGIGLSETIFQSIVRKQTNE